MKLLVGSSLVLVLFVAGLSIVPADRAYATHGCCSPQWCDLSTSPGSFSSSGLNFSGTLFNEWCFPAKPNNGFVEVIDSSQDNVAAVAYNPAYWFPNNCHNVVSIAVTGTKDQAGSPATLTTKGSVWSGSTGLCTDLEQSAIP